MRNLLYTIIILIITGCSYSSPRHKVLDEAQRLMQSDPTSALSRLNGVDVSELQDSATMARWALLYSEAIVANRLSVPTDTIVNIAIDFYGRHNLKDEFQRASRLKALMRSSESSDALANALYLQKEKEFLLYKERSERRFYMFAGIVSLCMAVGIIIWLRQRLRLQKLQNETLIAEASGLKSSIDKSQGDVCRLESKLHEQLETRFSLIDSLCQTYYESQGTKAERKTIMDKVKIEIDSLRTDSFSEMERAVNDCRDNLLIFVKDNYAGIRNDDYKLLVYLASNLSTRTICLLIGESVDVIYKRKSRLKSRLKESVAPLRPDIMTIF